MLRRSIYQIYPNAKIRIKLSSQSGADVVSNQGLILLLGWGGSVPRNLKKIEEFYESKNVNVISFIMPLGVFKFVRNYFIDDLIASINRYSNNESIYVHSYSNNGLWVYSELSQRLDEVNGNGIKKIIIDSAPHFIYEQVTINEEANLFTKVITSVVSKRKYSTSYSPIIYSSLFLLSATSRLINKICELLNIKNIFIPDLIQLSTYLRDKVPLVDTYFIYSSGDELIPMTTIKTFKENWRQRNYNNVPIQSHEFGDNVAHTSSFYVNTEEYQKILSKFFNI